MRYLCLIYYDEKALDALSADEYEALVAEAAAYDDDLRESGHLVVGEVLQRAAATATVRSRQGRVSTSGGPLVETSEQLGGFLLIEARDLNEAIQVAARVPPGRFGCVEVRPVQEPNRS